MKKSVGMLVGVAVLATPALAQVRPADCRPVFPVMDRAAAAAPLDVVTEPAQPAVAATKRFFGLPFLLPLLAAAGGVGALANSGSHSNDTPPVSPA